MSQVTSIYPQNRLHVLPSTGDIDQDPNSTDLWYSFEDQNEPDSPKVHTLAFLDDDDHQRPHTLDFIDEELNIVPDYLKNCPQSLPELTDKDNSIEVQFINKFKREKGTQSVQRMQQDFFKGAQIFDKQDMARMLRNYKKNRDGTIEMINKEYIKRQKQALGYLVKQFGYTLFSGESLTTLSLPVTVFEARSDLERQAQKLVYAPHFLEKGGLTRNTFEQFKLAITHFVTGIHPSINPQKAFNPILGETFQGIVGGCPVFLEQISQHPSVAAFQMIGENFTFEGCLESSASLSINSIRHRKLGYPKIIYKSNNTVVQAQCPTLVMNGIAYGKRTLQVEGKFKIFDLENQFYSEINFDASNISTLLEKNDKSGKDYFTGSIWKINDNFTEMLRKNIRESHREIKSHFIEKEHAICKIENIEGLWLEYVMIGDHTYWSLGNPWPYQLQYFDHVLPSDSNKRLDICFLKENDEIEAQKQKRLLEEVEKLDKKLRMGR